MLEPEPSAVPAPRREWWREGLALATGVLLFLSFPKFGHGAVAWVALLPLLLAIPGTTPRRAARLGYLAGVSGAIGLLYWTALVVIQYGGLSLPVGVGVMLLLSLAFGLPNALFGWAMGRACRRFGTSGLLMAPAFWVATEILRAHTLFEFPWCLLGYSQHRILPVIQIADLAGVYGVSFVVASASAVAAFVLLDRRRVEPRAAGAALLGLLGATAAYGFLRLAQDPPTSGTVRAALVQASVTQQDKWDPAKEMETLDRHVMLSDRAMAEKPQLVVWPESAVPFYFDYEPQIADPLRNLARSHGISLIFGNDDVEPRAADVPRVWVGAKMLGPDGALAYRYHKNRLVPFGEYVPLKSVFTLGGRVGARLVRNVGEFTAGTEAAVGRLDGHPLGTFICYEAIFPDLVRQFSGNGAELLVNITNDGWYGTTSAPYQHFAMATFRAVENRKWLLRAANTGISAFIDPHGRVVRASSLFERTVVSGEAAFVPGLTVYARIGDAFAWSCLAIAVGAVLLTFRKSK
jgi:apolipoprotein N-acyltransferase